MDGYKQGKTQDKRNTSKGLTPDKAKRRAPVGKIKGMNNDY